MENKQKLRQLVSQKDQITKEILEIQEECPHKEQHIKFISADKTSVGRARWVCKICEKVLSIPSSKDIENWMKK
tara:strand:- start:2034 stop:2255 length:222 start_codon:yes stop_codon:yes gene_type:complete